MGEHPHRSRVRGDGIVDLQKGNSERGQNLKYKQRKYFPGTSPMRTDKKLSYQHFMEKLDDAINNVVDNITLADLIKWQELNNGGVE